MAELDLTAPRLDFRVDKGHNFDPVLWVLDEDNAPINLSGYEANMQVKEAYSDATPLFDLTVANNGMTIVGPSSVTIKAGKELNGVVLAAPVTVAGVYGLQPHISAALMSAVVPNSLVHYVDLIEPGGRVLPYAKGKIKLTPDGTT
jgi:hypothetical protein